MSHRTAMRNLRDVIEDLAKGKKRAHQPGYHLAVTGTPGHLRHDWVPDDAPTGVALFAGAGGASLGVHRAGVRLIGAYDFDEGAISTKGTVQLVRSGQAPGTFERVRTLTVPERAALQGMPHVPSATGKHVGNAVPPALAEAVVRQVVAAHRRRNG